MALKAAVVVSKSTNKKHIVEGRKVVNIPPAEWNIKYRYSGRGWDSESTVASTQTLFSCTRSLYSCCGVKPLHYFSGILESQIRPSPATEAAAKEFTKCLTDGKLHVMEFIDYQYSGFRLSLKKIEGWKQGRTWRNASGNTLIQMSYYRAQ